MKIKWYEAVDHLFIAEIPFLSTYTPGEYRIPFRRTQDNERRTSPTQLTVLPQLCMERML